MAELTPQQVDYFIRYVPELEARRHYGTAKLIATLLNQLGGKGDIDDNGNEKKSSKPPKPDHLLFTPEELLPDFAWFVSNRAERVGTQLTRAAAEDILSNLSEIPAWALSLVPIPEAKGVIRAES